MPQPHLFFATITAGGGHVATARAMLEALEQNYPGQFHLSLSDYMKEVGERVPSVARLDQQHKDGWRWALRYPLSARLGQRLIDALPSVTLRVQRRLLDAFAQAAASDLERRSPRLVISNHGLLTTGLALARRRYGLKVPVLTFATETHNISAYWADPWADHILTPNEAVADSLARMGVPRERLEVVGYPVQQAFLNAPEKAKARSALGLDERFTVVVSLGGEGLAGDTGTLVRDLASGNPAWLILVMCGRNAALKQTLDALKLPNVRAEGYSERMAEVLAAADAVVGKAGPASVYEALAVGRPVLVTSYAGLNELGVVRFLEAQGLGAHLADSAQVVTRLRRYHGAPEQLEEIAARCLALRLPEQTERLARRVVQFLESQAMGSQATGSQA